MSDSTEVIVFLLIRFVLKANEIATVLSTPLHSRDFLGLPKLFRPQKDWSATIG